MNRAATEDVRVAGVAGRQPGAARPARRRTRSTRRSWRARRLGAPRRAAPRRRQQRPVRRRRADDHGRGLAADRRGGHATGVRRPLRRSTGIRGLGGLAGESYVDKDLRTLLDAAGQGPVRPALLRQRVARRVPGVAVGGRRPGRCRARRGAGRRPDGVAQRRVAAPASRPASSPTRSGPRTARRSSRCSSSSSGRPALSTVPALIASHQNRGVLSSTVADAPPERDPPRGPRKEMLLCAPSDA